MIIVPDTNFFLHFKDAVNIPWGDLTQDDEITIVICRTVQEELDRKERELKGRTQKRARKINSLIGDLGGCLSNDFDPCVCL